ncbi:MAG: hypothetical protein LH468_09445 [Nocardioides sp.]|nr:hypothetical protein [Nocardioides sp.]
MRRFAMLATTVVSAVALAVPTVGVTTSSAAPGSAPQVSGSAFQAVAAAGKLKVTKAFKGVQPGIAKQRITAFVNGGGKVKFTLKGTGITKNKKVRAKKGKAVYKVPALGTGTYKVTATYNGRKGGTKFKVFNSNLAVNSTTFTFSKSATDTRTYASLSGSVFFKDAPATSGFVDFYQNGNIKGGSDSPFFLGFTSIRADGTFDASTNFGSQITKGSGLAGSNLAAFEPGTYTFQAYYTADAGFDDYISSNFITVVVTP